MSLPLRKKESQTLNLVSSQSNSIQISRFSIPIRPSSTNFNDSDSITQTQPSTDSDVDFANSVYPAKALTII